MVIYLFRYFEETFPSLISTANYFAELRHVTELRHRVNFKHASVIPLQPNINKLKIFVPAAQLIAIAHDCFPAHTPQRIHGRS